MKYLRLIFNFAGLICQAEVCRQSNSHFGSTKMRIAINVILLVVHFRCTPKECWKMLQNYDLNGANGELLLLSGGLPVS
jgi:hypothetical protein